MSAPVIHGKRPVFSDSNALSALGRAIHEIRHADDLTWDDVGKVLGVSDDQASNYANEIAAMNAVAFGRGKREWNGRFTGYFDRLCVDSRPSGSRCDHSALTTILNASASLSHALEDGTITAQEVRDNRSVLESARDAIDEQLRKLKVEAA